jgi:hypothetical protein
MGRIRIRLRDMLLVDLNREPSSPHSFHFLLLTESSLREGVGIGTDDSTLSNPNTSEEAKNHAREELKKMGVEY